MSYKSSTQLKKWIFKKEELEQQRNTVNNAYCESFKSTGNTGTSNLVTPEEEQQLLFHYRLKMMEIGQKMNLPDAVYCTAIAYLNRFYLKKSVMEINPKQAMKVCIYVACKTEDNHLEIDSYAGLVDITPKAIVEMEIPLLESLQFHLIVYHPFRPLYGLLLDINDLLASNQHSKWLNSSTFTFESIYEAAKKYILKSVITDCCFLYHPYQIALACLDLAWPQFNTYFELKFKQFENHQQIQTEINEIKQLLLNVPDKPDIEQVKSVDRKLLLLIKSLKKDEDKKKKKKSSGSSGSSKKQKTDSSSAPKTNTETTAAATTTEQSSTEPTTTTEPTTDAMIIDSTASAQ